MKDILKENRDLVNHLRQEAQSAIHDLGGIFNTSFVLELFIEISIEIYHIRKSPEVLKYYSLVPKCVDFPDGEVREAKSLKLPYQFNNDDDIERLFANEKPTFESGIPTNNRVIANSKDKMIDFESEIKNNGTEHFFPIEGPNDFMFNDFEIIGSDVLYESEARERTFQEYIVAVEEYEVRDNEEDFISGFFEEKTKSPKKNSVCEKLQNRNQGMFCNFFF